MKINSIDIFNPPKNIFTNQKKTFFFKYLKYFFTFLILHGAFLSFSQVTTDTLSTVEIVDKKTIIRVTDNDGFTAGQATQNIDKRYLQFYTDATLSQLLSQQSSVFIKSYGVNSLSTLSVRGASAAQSSVLWNGVPIMNPALGVADISLLQSGLFDNIALQYGSSAALFGSGNVGGALMLNDNVATYNDSVKKISFFINAGSFNKIDGAAQAYWSNNKLYVSVKAFYQTARNNFRYSDEAGLIKNMDNASLHAGGAILSFGYNLNQHKRASRHDLSLDIWYQQYHREIPPALFESLSQKKQKDESLRTLLQWNYSKKGNTWYVKSSINKESLWYNDDVIQLLSESNVWQYYQEIGYKKQWQSSKNYLLKQQLLLFTPLQYAAIKTSDTGEYSQMRPAIAAAYNFTYDRLTLNTTFRQEWWNGKAAPILPGVGLNYKLIDNRIITGGRKEYYVAITLKGTIQRTYRIPTLNELYTFPGGNQLLKPEQGWSREVGYIMDCYTVPTGLGTFYTHPFIKHELVYFNRDIKDWIIWLGGAIWTPHNLAEVYSRGVETRNSITIPFGKVEIIVGLNTTYVLSTSKQSYLPGDSSIGRQIPYTPRYIYQGNIGVQWNHVFVNYNHSYNGYRFVTMDESQYLKPYQTGNVQVAYNFPIKKMNIAMTSQVQNIWNVQYQVVSARPMPGRYFLLGLRLIL